MVSPRTASFCAGLMILVSGFPAFASQSSVNVSPTQPAGEIAQSNRTPSRLLARRVRRDLAKRLNVAPRRLQIVETTAQTWPDQCFGLARPNERCMGGEIQGWQVQVVSAQQMWTYRTDRAGQRLRLEPLSGTPEFGRGDFSAEVSQQLLETVSQQVQQPIDSLEILEVQPAIWDGCLGISEPDTFCTAIAIAGFRTIISDGQTTWVYHLSEDGTQIAQNSSASGAGSPVSTLFRPIESEQVPGLDSEIIFQSQLSGDLTGSVQVTALTADGTLYREQSRLVEGEAPTRTVIRQLSPEEMSAFRGVLEQQRFPNLNRIRYLTEAAFADYPTTRLEAHGISVEYIDLEVESLPVSLRNVIAAWRAIAPS
ncbi:hypothetical protein [Leptolyngbya sp. BC1307]|uniref:hypothetical protein n=1 Tax=Leptolyngbya sp. BC1307 TaxID=2029589 RepID=UPI000EFB1F07|nr:hypothetical protein [Leptolyngbya sp. BC1307]